MATVGNRPDHAQEGVPLGSGASVGSIGLKSALSQKDVCLWIGFAHVLHERGVCLCQVPEVKRAPVKVGPVVYNHDIRLIARVIPG